MSALAEVSQSNFDTEVLKNDQPVLVDFWAPWCGPCRMISPIVDEIADAKAGSAKVGKVNVDENPNLAAQFNVRAIPMMAFFKGGELAGTVTGVQSKDALLKKVQSL